MQRPISVKLGKYRRGLARNRPANLDRRQEMAANGMKTGSGTTQVRQQGSDQFVTRLISFTSRAYFSESDFANLPSSSLPPPTGSMAPLSKVPVNFGSLSALFISSFRRVTIEAGVPAGTKAPYQASSTTPLYPDSSMVGTSGSNRLRLAAEDASILMVPAAACGIMDVGPRIATFTWAAMRSLIA